MALTIVRKRGKRARKKWPTPRAPDRYLTHAERLAVRTSKHWVAGFPQLVAEWHPKKNIDLYPYEVRAGSARQVWWKCPKGPDHEWLARVHNRVPKRQRPRGSGCPFCAGKRVSVTTCLAATRPKIAAEWHPTKNAKLTPHEVLPGDTRAVWWKCRKGPDHEYRQTIVTRAEGHQGCPYCRNFLLSVTNSLETKFPTLAAEWHPTKNRSLTAADVRAVDKRAFWWLCDKAPGGRAWRATIGWRRLGAKCPHCTSFAAKHPKLLAEWHVSKNAGVDPWSLKPSARRAVWWKCASGARDHVWKTTIAQRTQEKTRCPFCARKAVSSSTSLKALFPQIARQWHPTKNGSRTPDAIAPTTPQKAWWSCGKPGHVWEQSVGARTRKKKVECPFCAGRRAARETSLARTHPAIAALWDKTKNGEITPRDVTAQSDRLIHWKCDKGPDHEWTDRIGQRIRAQHRCPFCSNLRRSETNTLAAARPDLAAQWHPKKNGRLTPGDVQLVDARQVWWMCPKGPDHVWKTRIDQRVTSGRGCPFCGGYRLSVTNSFAAKFPELVRELHPTKNSRLDPAHTKSSSTTKVWWRCSRDPSHEWETSFHHRTSRKQGCPFCARRRVQS